MEFVHPQDPLIVDSLKVVDARSEGQILRMARAGVAITMMDTARNMTADPMRGGARVAHGPC